MIDVGVGGTGSGTKGRGRGLRLTADMRRRLAFTVGMLVLYRVGSYLPAPGVDMGAVADAYGGVGSGGLESLSALNLLSGGALGRMGLLALGCTPIVTAQIAMQVLTAVVPALSDLSGDDAGRRRITMLTRCISAVFAVIGAVGCMLTMSSMGLNFDASAAGPVLSRVVVIVSMAVGAILTMWMGELITERGVGNGVSLIIAANVLSGLPSAITASWDGGAGAAVTVGILLVAMLVVPVIVMAERGQRRIPVVYARRVRTLTPTVGDATTYLPVKVNMCGVIPVILASTLMAIPGQLASFVPHVAWAQDVAVACTAGPWNWALTALLIVAMSRLYSGVAFDADKCADAMCRAGGFVPGVRPGDETARLIRHVVDCVTLPGAVMMALVTVVPSAVTWLLGSPLATALGGTSLVIMVGVAIDTSASVWARGMEPVRVTSVDAASSASNGADPVGTMPRRVATAV